MAKEIAMMAESDGLGLSRRRLLSTVAGCAGAAIVSPLSARAPDDDSAVKLVRRLTGKIATASRRVRLAMPKVFPNGYTVPLALEIDTPMTEADHVKYVRVLAPKNPLIEVATFHFMPGRSEARVATRIRLAEPQFVLAVAEMNDGALLLAQSWVEVTINGCK